MKKLFGTVFILILLFSLIACSSSNENNDQIDNEVLDKTDDEMFSRCQPQLNSIWSDK